MEEYSEKQLLLLSNLVYLDVVKQDGSVKEIIDRYRAADGTFTEESVRPAGYGGGLYGKEVKELFTIIDDECAKNPSFGELSPSRRLEQNDVRAICYTDREDSKPVIVFRGTGGTKEAWTDNMYGGFKKDTRIQKIANDFVKHECGVYEDVVVTGHSKGGNLSQYVTIMNGEKVKSCVSFDGQGMNKEFIEENAENIKNTKGKIKSICAYNDFVNILLTSIAGSVMFVKNSQTGANAHSSFYLLTSNEYDGNGNFISKKSQSLVTKSMKDVTDKIVSLISINNDTDNALLGGILGEAIATMVMAGDKNEMLGSVKKAANETMMMFSMKLDGLFSDVKVVTQTLPSGGIYFDCDSIKRIADNVGDAVFETGRISRKLLDIKEKIDYDISSRIFTDLALLRSIDELERLGKRLNSFEEMLKGAAYKYSDSENSIMAMIRAD